MKQTMTGHCPNCKTTHTHEGDGDYISVECACGRWVLLLPVDDEQLLADALRHLPSPPGG